MTKKEGANKEHMTKEEVRAHLKGIGTTNARITYLKDILTKRGLLSEETQKNVYGLLAESLSQSWKKPGRSRKESLQMYNELLDTYQNAGEYSKAGKLAEHNNSFYEATRLYNKVGSLKDELRSIKKHLKKGGESWGGQMGWLDGDPGSRERLERREKTLEKKLGEAGKTSAYLPLIITILGLGAGLFFLSYNLTGNIIGNSENYTNNWIGIGLIALGLMGLYFWKRK
tara:strand:- start:1641 stop:2324 length:684 start_codon:yes stop_codon:yes gene_type:complete